MISSQKLKSIKWISIVGAVVNLVLLGFMLYALNRYQSVKAFEILIYISVIDVVFTLLLISSSLRIDQIFYRLKWVNILCSVLSLTIVLSIYFINKENAGGEFVINMGWQIYTMLGISIVLMLTDVVIIKLKYRNNPFYHNGKVKKTYAQYKDITPTRQEPTQNVNQEVIENNEVRHESPKQEVVDELANLSYFERYQKRSEELQKVDDDFDNGLINEQEYQKRRKNIYAKYDKYN